MESRNAVMALNDEHERATRYLLSMMENWTDDTLKTPVEGWLQSVEGILVHVVGCIYEPYFEWMQVKLGVKEIVPSPMPRSQLNEISGIDAWRKTVADTIPYVRRATEFIVDDDLGKAFPAYWNNNEIYMIEQMFEHAIVHIWRHIRQLERLGV
jgi:uncharacterized damage-inducible protein DinB